MVAKERHSGSGSLGLTLRDCARCLVSTFGKTGCCAADMAWRAAGLELEGCQPSLSQGRARSLANGLQDLYDVYEKWEVMFDFTCFKFQIEAPPKRL
jgi:hypothetical protein